jgi:hypothetical protein
VLAALALLGAAWPLKATLAIAALAHAVVLRPRRTPRLVWCDGRVAVPDRGLENLTLGPRSRHCRLWIRLDLRGAGRGLEVLLLADQLEPTLWRTLRAELARPPADAKPASGDPRGDLR